MSPTEGVPPTRRLEEAEPRAPESATPDTLRAEPLFGRYRLLERIGQGGMGEVHRAYDPRLGRVVAIKRVIAKGDARAAEEQQRLRREAQAIAQLSHPNVIAVYDVGVVDEQLYVAMEYVAGLPLHRWLAQRAPSRAAILEVFTAAARGLAAAHDAGLVHRDFKPANVIVGEDGRVRVLDFGLARRAGGAAQVEPLSDGQSDERAAPEQADAHGENEALLAQAVTRPGAVAGTPRYMAPEQFLLRPIDGRSDQFAFGVALYEALTGERPFAGEDVLAIGKAVVRGELRPIPAALGLPEWLRALLVRALERHAADRFPSMRDLIDELSRDRKQARAEATTAATRAADLVSTFPPPDDPRVAERVGWLAPRLDHVGELKRVGDFEAAIALGRVVCDEAADLDYAPFQAACLYTLGSLQHRTGDAASAEATLERAAELAARGGDDWQIANAWVALVPVLGEGMGRFAEARRIAHAADVAITRLGGNASLRSRLAIARGRNLRAEDRLAESARAFELALAFDEEAHGAEHPFLAIGLLELAETEVLRDRVADAERHLDRAFWLLRDRRTGPTYAACLLVAARTDRARRPPRPDAAQHKAREAAQIFARYPDRRSDRVEALGEEALALLAQGDAARALEQAEVALDLASQVEPLTAAFVRIVAAEALRVAHPERASEADVRAAFARRVCQLSGSGADARFTQVAARVGVAARG